MKRAISIVPVVLSEVNSIIRGEQRILRLPIFFTRREVQIKNNELWAQFVLMRCERDRTKETKVYTKAHLANLDYIFGYIIYFVFFGIFLQ